MKKVFAAGIALAILFGDNTATFAAYVTNFNYSDQATQAFELHQ
jgi:hypothetical protein